MMFGGNIKRTPQTVMEAWLAYRAICATFVGLKSSSLVFALLREAQPRTSPGIPGSSC